MGWFKNWLESRKPSRKDFLKKFEEEKEFNVGRFRRIILDLPCVRSVRTVSDGTVEIVLVDGYDIYEKEYADHKKAFMRAVNEYCDRGEKQGWLRQPNNPVGNEPTDKE